MIHIYRISSLISLLSYKNIFFFSFNVLQRGTVAISKDHMFEIHPLPDHLSENYRKENVPHLVIKRSIADQPVLFDDDWIGKVLCQGLRPPPPTTCSRRQQQ